ncbi:MAG: UPF0182 family protein [Desulfomonilia bacterium]
MTRRHHIGLVVLGILIVIVFLFFSSIVSILVHWIWMESLGFEVIFYRVISIKLSLFVVSFIIVFVFSLFTFRRVWANSLSGEDSSLKTYDGTRISTPQVYSLILVVALILSLVFALSILNQWDTIVRWYWRVPFDQADTIYHHDIGFYIFTLPFYELVQNSLSTLFFLVLAAVTLGYVIFGKIRFDRDTPISVDRPVGVHVSLLGILFLCTLAAGYLLDRYQLLYSAQGAVYGMGYTDYQFTRIGLWIMAGASILLAVVIAVNLALRKVTFLVAGAATFLALLVLFLWLIPAGVQKFIVEPNELEKEQSFLEKNISMTRHAFDLERIENRSYPFIADLTPSEIMDNEETIKNIRLWDWRPIRQTYRQTQEIRLYYKFYDVDVGRYQIPGEGYRQVMLSARELVEALPEQARTWVNSHLQFTHGYGLAMSFVTDVVEEGFPRYVIKDIPPVSEYLEVVQPGIYYGESTPGYRIVNTGIKELDFPKGDENVYTSYQGSGGIPITGLGKRLLFALHQGDINILLSRYISSESRIQLWRNVQERITRIAPFLVLDKDPYLVLSQGSLYWIQDAYTVSNRYPYSEPYEINWNYIRNSAKVVIDAYEGSVSFYIADQEDPLISVYAQAFPGVFQDLDAMPDHIKQHIRYPQDLFIAQVEKFRTYHMTNTQVFYNREDLWSFPQEKYGGTSIPMEPYFILMRLPGEDELQYIMMMPMTPENRDNMIAWIASKSDFPSYGELIVFKLPKERIIYGPVQIEAMIDQDDVISQQLSLWDQRGSQVIRGNLLVIPVNHSFLYVEPVYLIAEGTDIPQLKRVIVVHGDRVAMEKTLRESIAAVFGREKSAQIEDEPGMGPPVPHSTFTEQMKNAREALGEGNWKQFGEAMDEIQKLLNAESEPGK